MSYLLKPFAGNVPTGDDASAPKYAERLKSVLHNINERELSTVEDVNALIVDVNREIVNGEVNENLIKEAIESINKDGLGEATVIAVESLLPGCLSPSAKLYATRYPSKTENEKHLVALESAGGMGRYALISIIVAAIIKIIAWILNNSATPKKDPVKGNKPKTDEADPDSELIKQLGMESVDEVLMNGFLDAYKAADRNKTAQTTLANFVKVIDGAFKQHQNFAKLCTACDAVTSGGFKAMYKRIAEGDVNDATIPALMTELFGRAGVYNKIYGLKPGAFLSTDTRLKDTHPESMKLVTVELIRDLRERLNKSGDFVGLVNGIFDAVLAGAQKEGDHFPTAEYTALARSMEEYIGMLSIRYDNMKDANWNDNPFSRRHGAGDQEGYRPLGKYLQPLVTTGIVTSQALLRPASYMPDLSTDVWISLHCDLASAIMEDLNKYKLFNPMPPLETASTKSSKNAFDKLKSKIDKMNQKPQTQVLWQLLNDTAPKAQISRQLYTMDAVEPTAYDVIMDVLTNNMVLWQTFATMVERVKLSDRSCNVFQYLKDN